MQENIIEIKNLKINFCQEDSFVPVLSGLSLEIKEDEIVALVGGSGSGKTITGLSILKLLPYNGVVTEGKILFEGNDLLKLSEDKMQKIRGKDISFIFQEPLSALNPVFNIGFQVREVLRFHTQLTENQISEKLSWLIKKVGLPDAQKIIRDYPHQLSAGMRQRVMIACAIASNPKLLIADEPTSNLDVTVQARIMDLFLELKKEMKLSILLITHDLGLVEHFAQKVAVISQGKIVESGETSQILNNPKASYTKELLEASRL